MTWHLEPPVLTGKYCVVREVLPADASALVRTVTNEAVVRFIPAPPQSARAFDKFIELAIELRTNGKGLSLVVVPLSRGVASGLVTLRGPENGQALWNIGFLLAEDLWGQGLMQDALGEVIGYAHDKMGLQQIEAWTLTTNARAHRVLDRLGAVSETRPDSLAPDGRRADHLRWVLMFAP